MELTEAQYRLIEHCLPRQRGNVTLSNLQVLNAILYVAEQGCNWRSLPKRFGKWHTVYTRMNRWSRRGVLDRVFAQLQHDRIVCIRIEAVVRGHRHRAHPDGRRCAEWPANRQPGPRWRAFVWLPRLERSRSRRRARQMNFEVNYDFRDDVGNQQWVVRAGVALLLPTH
jgi:transposase